MPTQAQLDARERDRLALIARAEQQAARAKATAEKQAAAIAANNARAAGTAPGATTKGPTYGRVTPTDVPLEDATAPVLLESPVELPSTHDYKSLLYMWTAVIAGLYILSRIRTNGR